MKSLLPHSFFSAVAGLALTASSTFAQSTYTPYTFTTVACSWGIGTAQFNWPGGVAVDGAGNVYVADTYNSTIRKVTAAGVVTTLAGGGGSVDGTGSGARFYNPQGVAVDGAGNVYVADTHNHTIRKMTPAGVVTTLAGLAGFGGSEGETGSTARFYYPSGMAVDGAGNVYVADPGDATIRKVTPAGVVTTLAGLVQFDQLGNSMAGSADGTGSAARFQYPQGVAVDSSGTVYVADTGNYTIRKGYPALMMLSFGPSFGFNDGQFGFVLSGPPGQLVVVEASTDLVDWLPLWTNTFAGDLQFSDLQSDAYPYRFYRAHLP